MGCRRYSVVRLNESEQEQEEEGTNHEGDEGRKSKELSSPLHDGKRTDANVHLSFRVDI
jgi:hypothetical protein